MKNEMDDAYKYLSDLIHSEVDSEKNLNTYILFPLRMTLKSPVSSLNI